MPAAQRDKRVGTLGMASITTVLPARDGTLERSGRRLPRPIATVGFVLGLGLLLGACTKCDVWKWQAAGQTPHSCNDTPAPN
jgi:hypothetical protein